MVSTLKNVDFKIKKSELYEARVSFALFANIHVIYCGNFLLISRSQHMVKVDLTLPMPYRYTRINGAQKIMASIVDTEGKTVIHLSELAPRALRSPSPHVSRDAPTGGHVSQAERPPANSVFF